VKKNQEQKSNRRRFSKN